MEVKFVKPTREMINIIAEDMRQADIDEIWASNNSKPIESLLKGWDISDFSVIVTVNNEPCVMMGLVVKCKLTGLGVPWLLGTESAMKYRKYFLTETSEVINEMLEICPRLYNYVHIKNKISMRWLKWMGFKLDKPIEYGIDKELFCKFSMEKIDV